MGSNSARLVSRAAVLPDSGSGNGAQQSRGLLEHCADTVLTRPATALVTAWANRLPSRSHLAGCRGSTARAGYLPGATGFGTKRTALDRHAWHIAEKPRGTAVMDIQFSVDGLIARVRDIARQKDGSCGAAVVFLRGERVIFTHRTIWTDAAQRVAVAEGNSAPGRAWTRPLWLHWTCCAWRESWHIMALERFPFGEIPI